MHCRRRGDLWYLGYTRSRKHASHPLTGDKAPAKRQCIAVHHIPACWLVYDRGCVALGCGMFEY